MKRILVTGAGGTPGKNFVTSLKNSPEEFYFIGVDCDRYYLKRVDTNERYLVPKANESDYMDVLLDIIAETKPGMIYPQTDQEIGITSKNREKILELGVRLFLPAKETIEICHSKYESFKYWKAAGLKVPETIKVENEADLRQAFEKFGSPIWVRAIVSPGAGVGSFKAADFEKAKMWIDFCDGWGNFTAAECLEPNSITWSSLWRDGELIVAQGRKRMYWEFANRAPSGITGITGTGVTVSDFRLDEIALKAIKAIDKNPHGVFSVDLTFDKEGIPNPTEINIGRFFTTHNSFTAAGLNLPYIFIKLAFDEEIPEIPRKINPLPPGLAWIRGMDYPPVLIKFEHLEEAERELDERRKKLARERN